MTNPIEQEFYKAFDIESNTQITDTVMLKLLTVKLLEGHPSTLTSYLNYLLSNDEELKYFLLQMILKDNKKDSEFYHTVRKIMGVGDE